MSAHLFLWMTIKSTNWLIYLSIWIFISLAICILVQKGNGLHTGKSTCSLTFHSSFILMPSTVCIPVYTGNGIHTHKPTRSLAIHVLFIPFPPDTRVHVHTGSGNTLPSNLSFHFPTCLPTTSYLSSQVMTSLPPIYPFITCAILFLSSKHLFIM